MSARFLFRFLAISASILSLCVHSNAQELSATNAPAVSAKGGTAAPAKATATSAVAPATSAKLTTPVEQAKQLTQGAIKKMDANDIDGAMSDLNQALKLNPEDTGAY